MPPTNPYKNDTEHLGSWNYKGHNADDKQCTVGAYRVHIRRENKNYFALAVKIGDAPRQHILCHANANYEKITSSNPEQSLRRGDNEHDCLHTADDIVSARNSREGHPISNELAELCAPADAAGIGEFYATAALECLAPKIAASANQSNA